MRTLDERAEGVKARISNGLGIELLPNDWNFIHLMVLAELAEAVAEERAIIAENWHARDSGQFNRWLMARLDAREEHPREGAAEWKHLPDCVLLDNDDGPLELGPCPCSPGGERHEQAKAQAKHPREGKPAQEGK